jgi:3-oxoacyl-(acyl-carrier-protein) synthase
MSPSQVADPLGLPAGLAKMTVGTARHGLLTDQVPQKVCKTFSPGRGGFIQGESAG